MLLISRDTELTIFAELISEVVTVENENESLSLVLDNKFTDNHQISLIVEDSKRQHAIFVTESYHRNNNELANYLIDSVTLLKIVLSADNKLNYKQIKIALPEQRVNTKVICSLSEN
jgi:hypothetical protein